MGICLSVATCGAFSVFAQDVDSGKGGSASITISNAANGETYKVIKIFGANLTAGAPVGGPITYTGDIPAGLESVFEKNATTLEITAKSTAVDASGDFTSTAIATITNWAKDSGRTIEATGVGDGTPLRFTGLQYGYYVITTTQGAVVTVDDTNPNVTVVDKNTTEPTIQKKVKNASGEWVEVTDADIAQDKEFKLDITTANWHQALDSNGDPTGDQKQVKSYTIGEDFDTNKFTLSSIDSVTVVTLKDDGTVNETLATITPPSVFPITVPWIDASNTSLYPNGAVIRIIYKAKLNDDAIIDVGNTNEDLRGNVNTADLDWTYDDNTNHFGDGHAHLTDTAAVDTYAIALKKFDKSGTSLAGAKFQFPFYVAADPNGVAVQNANGDYVYAGTTAGTGLTNEIITRADGMITVVGVKAGTYSITETEAPTGYNKLAAPVSVTATKISTTTTITTSEKWWKIDENGQVFDLKTTDPTTVTKTEYTNDKVIAIAVPVINLQGSVLPSTGGSGTTMIYIIGVILLAGAGILLVTRRRMKAE